MHRIRLLLTLFLAGTLLTASLAHGAGTGVVVSQLYAGGGNAGASFTNDYVELLNRGSAAVSLDGWTLQYAAASGTSWQTTALSGSVAAGHYYLVQLGSTASVGSALPVPDATDTTNLAASGGKVALVHDTAALSCGAAAGSCSADARVADLVGYGSAADYEGGGAAPGLSSTTALLRADAGCTDTDVNSSDFATGTPAPRNSASTVASCGAAPPPPAGGTSQAAAVAADVQSLLSLSLEHPTLSFGAVATGGTPAALPEHVTVVSNDAAGYALTVHRTVFAPADLPVGIGATAPAGAQAGSALAGGVLAPVPVAPAADLLVGSAPGPSVSSGDVWAASLGFVSALPVVNSGHYTATVTFTVIGR